MNEDHKEDEITKVDAIFESEMSLEVHVLSACCKFMAPFGEVVESKRWDPVSRSMSRGTSLWKL